jgi:hypothetical protein
MFIHPFCAVARPESSLAARLWRTPVNGPERNITVKDSRPTGAGHFSRAVARIGRRPCRPVGYWSTRPGGANAVLGLLGIACLLIGVPGRACPGRKRFDNYQAPAIRPPFLSRLRRRKAARDSMRSHRQQNIPPPPPPSAPTGPPQARADRPRGRWALPPQLSAPTGPAHTSPGQRPGWAVSWSSDALKGQNTALHADSSHHAPP